MSIPAKSVTTHPDGSATAKVYIKGRRHQRKFSTSKLATDWLSKQRLEIERDEIYGRGDRVLFSTLVNQYRKEKTKSPNSISRDDYILKRITGWLKKRRVEYASEIKKGLMAEYENDRRKNDKVIQRTINMDIKLVAAILNHALKRDRIAYNPLAAYPFQSDGKPFSRYLMADEVKALLSSCKDSERLMIYAALTLGLRAEEVCYLEFSDVKNNVLHLGPKKIKDQHGERMWNPKWNRERWIPLDHEYVNDADLMAFFASNKSGYCFPNADFKDGRPMDRNGILKRVKRAARDARINDHKQIKAHTLRHTHVSFMVARVGIDKNISLRHIMDYVGINDLRTLMIYAKAVKDLSRNLPDPSRFPWQNAAPEPVTKK